MKDIYGIREEGDMLMVKVIKYKCVRIYNEASIRKSNQWTCGNF